MPKKKRAFTRVLKTPARNTNPPVPNETPTINQIPTQPAPVPNPTRATSSQTKRKISVAELTRQLKRKQKDLGTLQSELSSQTRQIESLSKRNKQLIETTTKSRTDLRKQRKQSVQEESDNAKVVRELEEQVKGAEAKAASFVKAELEKQAVSSLVSIVIRHLLATDHFFSVYAGAAWYTCSRGAKENGKAAFSAEKGTCVVDEVHAGQN